MPRLCPDTAESVIVYSTWQPCSWPEKQMTSAECDVGLCLVVRKVVNIHRQLLVGEENGFSAALIRCK